MSGVYGLSNAREWIFVGETDNIKAKLLEHLQEPHTRLLALEPTGFVFEVCASHDRRGRQQRLIREYHPVCNLLPAEALERRRDPASGEDGGNAGRGRGTLGAVLGSRSRPAGQVDQHLPVRE